MKTYQLTDEEIEVIAITLIGQKWGILDDLYQNYGNGQKRKLWTTTYCIAVELLTKLCLPLKGEMAQKIALLEKDYTTDWEKKTNQTVGEFFKTLIEISEHPIFNV